MRLPRRRRPDFEAERDFEYPHHLRAAIEATPAAPGVYIFHGEEGGLPLYIGKSVNLRSRLLSHLRNPDEARLLRQTQRISHVRTAGEIGALLLEARWIKEQHPLLNQKLRSNRQLCSLQVQDGVPKVVYSKDLDFAQAPGLYGLYASRHAALDALRQMADDQRLCYGALGLEKRAPGRPCFRAMLQQCAGVCRGDETPESHRTRLFTRLEGLRVACWPYAGPVGLVERDAQDPQWTQIHVVHHWHYLGTVGNVAEALQLDSVAPGFDADGYKILCKPILSGRAEIIPLF
ncbi:MAG: excinuclease Cho [Burkholderiaceae bacterium]|nr:excinuclease Cho [Burkholderiaceae bacterium]